VWALAAQLPQKSYAINLCENRYCFLVAFCAVIVRAQTNLLPANRGAETQRALALRYPDSYILHDGLSELGSPSVFNIHDVSKSTEAFASTASIPIIDLEHLAAIAFTSGSTGEPQANLKTWRTFVDSTAINASYMLPDSNHTYFALATVPGQHMWGLETSILMPLMACVCIDDSRPLFPQDIAKRLSALPEPRLLISTPVHLRALCLSGLPFPRVEHILCATAPLTQQLAVATEAVLQGRLGEVFGCSEVGSMAYRNTASTDIWQLFNGLNLSEQADKTVQISAPHLPQTVTIQDSIESLHNGQFRLLGRGTDMLEIGGKRGSLLEMNKILQSHPEVLDAVVFLPEEQGPVQRLVAMVVTTRGEVKSELPEFLRQRLDPVFIPRPILIVDSLPREENGKLPRHKLLEFYNNVKREAKITFPIIT
jgi:acyl-coenzyme A synthetase/AMP-(fatty) acid ligase